VAESGRIEKLLGAGAGLVRMNAAVAGDLASALNPLSRNDGTPDDWLDAWDPSYIRTTLPTLRMFADVYHRAEVRGLDNIPAEGRRACARRCLVSAPCRRRRRTCSARWTATPRCSFTPEATT
jgi:hypothetical protein